MYFGKKGLGSPGSGEGGLLLVKLLLTLFGVLPMVATKTVEPSSILFCFSTKDIVRNFLILLLDSLKCSQEIS